MEKRLIKDLLNVWSKIVNSHKEIAYNDISNHSKDEILRIARNFYSKYSSLSCVKRVQVIEEKYNSFLLTHGYYSIYVPHFFYYDTAVGSVLPTLLQLFDVYEDGCPDSVYEFLFLVTKAFSFHFSNYKKFHIKIMKAIITLYDMNTLYENPPPKDIARYLEKSYDTVYQNLMHIDYVFRALVNYGKIGFYTIVIFDLPLELRPILDRYLLMKFLFRYSTVVVLSLPYSVYARLLDILRMKRFPLSSIFTLDSQSWNWNFNQLKSTEKESWKQPIRIFNDLRRTFEASVKSDEYLFKKPYLLQKITPPLLNTKEVEIVPLDMQLLQKLLFAFRPYITLAKQTFTTESQIAYSYQRLKKKGIINIRTDFRRIGLGVGLGLILTSPNDLSNDSFPVIRRITSLLLDYPFTWILTGDRILVAYLVFPRSWTYNCFMDLTRVTQITSNVQDDKLFSFNFALKGPNSFQPKYQLSWDRLWFEDNGIVVWKDPLVDFDARSS